MKKFIKFLLESVIVGGRIAVKKSEYDWYMRNLEHHLLGEYPRIGFAEGANFDVIRAVIWHVEDDFILSVLINHKKGILRHAKEFGTDTSGVKAAGMGSFVNEAEVVSRMLMICRGDWTREAYEDKLKDINYFSTMYLELDYIDGLVGSVIAIAAGTMHLALQPIRTAGNERAASGCVLLERDNIYYTMGDRTLSVDLSVQEPAEITLQCARTTRQFGIEPKVSTLSYSSFGSGGGESVGKVRVVAEHLKRTPLDFVVDREIRVDVAISPVVAKVKAPHSTIIREMNILILPNIDAGNIGYRIAVELGSFIMFGPILQGLHKPVNILMHKASVDTVCSIGIISGVQVVENRS